MKKVAIVPRIDRVAMITTSFCCFCCWKRWFLCGYALIKHKMSNVYVLECADGCLPLSKPSRALDDNDDSDS